MRSSASTAWRRSRSPAESLDHPALSSTARRSSSNWDAGSDPGVNGRHVASINGAQRGFMPPMTRELAASIADHRSPFPSHNPSIRHRASVKVGTARYILCRNEAEAERERIKRRAIIAGFAKLGEPVVLLRSYASANSAYGTIVSSCRRRSASRCSSGSDRSVNRRPQN